VCRQTDFLLVIGAGVVGLSIARALALAGKAVTIIDQSDYGTAASGSNLGQIFVSDRDPGLEHDLVLESLNIYQETERHNSLQYTRTGGLFTLDDEGETAIAEPLVREEKEPYIENAAGAVYSPLEGSINPFKVISWLYDQALAAGSWSRELCGTIGLDLPVDYIRGTAMVTEPLPRVLNGPVVGGFFTHAIDSGQTVFFGGVQEAAGGIVISRSGHAVWGLSSRRKNLFFAVGFKGAFSLAPAVGRLSADWFTGKKTRPDIGIWTPREEIIIYFNNAPLTVREGDTIAAALLAQGIRVFRRTRITKVSADMRVERM
jgi:glycine/D-amino acid oxidase-like deaminating enzyme